MCREEWLLMNRICPRCNRISLIMRAYSREKVIEALESIFLIPKFQEEKEDKYIKESGKWKLKEPDNSNQ